MSPHRRANVLIVDDQPENLLALRAVLDPLDLNVIEAGSGEEALKRLLHDDFAPQFQVFFGLNLTFGGGSGN